MIDYAAVLALINGAKDPVDAFVSFLAQEREYAAYEAKAEAWDEGWEAGYEDLDRWRGQEVEAPRIGTQNPYREAE